MLVWTSFHAGNSNLVACVITVVQVVHVLPLGPPQVGEVLGVSPVAEFFVWRVRIRLLVVPGTWSLVRAQQLGEKEALQNHPASTHP